MTYVIDTEKNQKCLDIYYFTTELHLKKTKIKNFGLKLIPGIFWLIQLSKKLNILINI